MGYHFSQLSQNISTLSVPTMTVCFETNISNLKLPIKNDEHYRASLLLQGGKGGAGGLLHPLVRVQDPLQQLRHQRLQVLVVRLLAHPVGIS